MIHVGLFTIGFLCLFFYATGILRDVYELRLACALMMEAQRSYADQQVDLKAYVRSVEGKTKELERVLERLDKIERKLERADWRDQWGYKNRTEDLKEWVKTNWYEVKKRATSTASSPVYSIAAPPPTTSSRSES